MRIVSASATCRAPSTRSMSCLRLSVTRPWPIPARRQRVNSRPPRDYPQWNSPSVIEPPPRSITPRLMKLSRTLPGGSASQHCVLPPLKSLRARVTPASVPPVPVAQMKACRPPGRSFVCAWISGPVVSMWTARFPSKLLRGQGPLLASGRICLFFAERLTRTG